MISLTIKLEGIADRKRRLSDEQIKIGRRADNLVVLNDDRKDVQEVSRYHARIDHRPTGYVLIDLSSAGTFLDGERVEPDRPIPLRDGAVIGIGPYDILFHDLDYQDVPETVVPFDAAMPARQVADRLCWVYASHLEEPTEVRERYLREALESLPEAQNSTNLRDILVELRDQFRGKSDDLAEPGDVSRQKQEQMYFAGERVLTSIARKLLGDGKQFASAADVKRFGQMIEHMLEETFEWVAKSVELRRKFKETFGTDVTRFATQGVESNPIKDARSAEDIARFALDFTSEDRLEDVRDTLADAFRALTMHQLGLMKGVQDTVKELIRLLGPEHIEQSALANAGALKSLTKISIATSPIWKFYRKTFEDLTEAQAAQRRVMFPNMSSGYLSAHEEAEQHGHVTHDPGSTLWTDSEDGGDEGGDGPDRP